ncbi:MULTISPECIES: IclR family transcriptional regulator [Delftia]|jgi:DNA-binding IclR family transcriptional regulator|uniref:IclR family transcriptional regulator n=1 Tax=Delftia TaxID=80865 RepID=UPI000806C51D|nr:MULTISPECIES: IclR family transcriptional regulator [Delftia]APE46852.1 IclR family transcriptional regulator [Delftia sp. HK171]MBD9584552.1 IclR family transcriptional regulator [Delftia sp. DLF01]MBJ2141397.1 IclR family transcriptional regulator [Delftia acidovorans]MBK0110908.1 IclR family transcriptional regulator [Delftia sp. S65]MBK0116342.1 IclR family transcriptional regulator [Delftia sp. S67]
MTSSSDAGSLKRGVAFLKLLATGGARGCPLSELAEKSGVPHPSAHRILKQLIAERLVVHDAQTHRYRLGPLAFELGLAGSMLHDIRDLCEPAMAALSRETEDTAYLVVRSGFEAVCLHRLEGDFPIRTLVLQVGSRRPLGVGAGGLAVLAAIAPEEREAIIERVAPALPAFGKLTDAGLRLACEETARAGVAVIQNRVSLGVTAVGAHFCDSMGQAMGAVSVAALTQRMTAARVRRIAQQVRAAAAQIEQRIRTRKR